VAKERRLGRGLEALLGRVAPKPDVEAPPVNPVSPPQDSRQDAPPHRPATSEPPFPSQPEAADAHQHLRFDQAHSLEEIRHAYTPNTEGDPPNLAATENVPPPPTPVTVEPAEPVETVETGGTSDTPPANPTRLSIAQIDSNPYQPRQDFNEAELESLGQSLLNHGLLQPVAVRKVGDRYQIVAGERRYRAAIKVGWTDVPVQVTEADDRQMAEMALVENIQRKDLNPLEKAVSFQRYLEQYGSTQEELASRLNMDRSTVANLIRLLELPEPVKDAVRQSKITQGHARALLPLGDEREQIEFSRRIQADSLSVRNTEAMVQEAIQAADAEPLNVIGRDGIASRTQRTSNEHIAALEQELRLALGTKVKITHNARGRGKLVIHFASHEEFERLKSQVCGPSEHDLHGQVG
jgi:ParB family transcriptional regulator, chromosome partitioning protein